MMMPRVNIATSWIIYATSIIPLILSTTLIVFLVTQNDSISCANLPDRSSKIICWNKLIERSLETKGLDKSMELVAKLYEEEAEFSPVCHDFVHLIGKKAYKLFSADKNFQISSKTSYCAYGFYHGFMENMVSERGDVSLAKDFCIYVDKQLSKITPNARLACFHGIGHGWTNTHDPKYWGDEKAMVYPALSLCEKVTQDPEELAICATGVFDSISIGYYNQSNGLKINKKNPYWLCQEQEEKYKRSCYMDLAPAILWLGDYRLDNSLSYLGGVESNYKNLEIETLAEGSVRFLLANHWDLSESIETCRRLGKSQNLICIGGLGAGFLQFGPPGKEGESAIGFCNSSLLNQAEKNSCFEKILKNMRGALALNKYQEICRGLNGYQQYCLSE